MTKYMRTAAAAALILGCVSCGDVVRTSHSPVNLLVTSLTSSTGSNTVFSDVVVMVTSPAPCSAASPCPTITADSGSATLSAPMKDVSIAPTTNNQVTLNRYHVDFVRADGRNIPGVDVPFPFDGAVTATIAGNGLTSVTFDLVRHVAKQESPLAQLVSSPNTIATIATITFYGTDAVGNAVAASGNMTVNFGNFADK
jgi:hypothetical protein